MLPEEFANIESSSNEFQKALYELDYGILDCVPEQVAVELTDEDWAEFENGDFECK